MTNEERIAVECVLRAYEEYFNLAQSTINEMAMNSRNYAINPDERWAKARGKIDGTKEVLRDLMNNKL